MYFGADYYPEHWPRSEWERHAKLMREANLNVVRIAEFAWAKMEPEYGVFDFSWLDDSIEILSAEGVKVVLGTPTATPPKWVMDMNPDMYMENDMGDVRGFGSRRHYCHNNPNFRAHTRRIVRAMAEHYKNHPQVISWQIDNEFGCHDTTRCYCNHCLEAFKVWLQKKYQTIDTLNQEWGTIFWSQTYRSFDEVILPKYTVCSSSISASGGAAAKSFSHNPALLLDFYRFSSDSVVSYQKYQIDLLKAEGCRQPITHNFMGHFSQLDYFDLAKDLDFVCWDNYITHQWGKSGYKSTSMAHDLMRGTKEKNFWVMEQQSGPCGWNVLGDTPKPGQLRLWTYQAVAHGADAIVYFRWRACLFGIEQYWYGILDHDGIPRRRYYEIQQIGNELKKLSGLLVGSEVVTKTAVIKSFDNLWSHEFQPHNQNFNYNNLLVNYYEALASNQINTDVVSIETNLDKYKLVFMPAFNLMREDIRLKVERFVKEGGTLVTTFRSGTRTWNNSMTIQTLPGAFKELAGVEVEEFDSINGGRKIEVMHKDFTGIASVWCDILKPITAEVVATYASDYYAGQPAITVNSYGAGRVFYIGCDLDSDFLNRIVKQIADLAGVEQAISSTIDGVEAVIKVKDSIEFMVLMNHNGTEASVSINGKYQDLITEAFVDASIILPAYGVVVLKRV